MWDWQATSFDAMYTQGASTAVRGMAFFLAGRAGETCIKAAWCGTLSTKLSKHADKIRNWAWDDSVWTNQKFMDMLKPARWMQ
eukprot:4824043-Amphidinium_carterae.1